jgi:pyruvate/2-oxoglutarate dehydrogenase complex dihydrolipoamide acyltransferase (E2) component
MAKPILMPQVGQDLTEGKLVELRVAVGDSVAKGDIVAVVESEKASFDVEAFESGVVLDVLYKEGDTTRVLEPLLFVGQPGESAASGAQKQNGGDRTASPAELAKLGSDPNEANPPEAPADAVEDPTIVPARLKAALFAPGAPAGPAARARSPRPLRLGREGQHRQARHRRGSRSREAGRKGRRRRRRRWPARRQARH